MNAAHIRKLLKRRPFRPIEILADGGEKLVVRHPESVLIGQDLVVVKLPDGSLDWIDARNVSKVRDLPRRAASR